MPYNGAALPYKIPEEVPIWPWLFESKYSKVDNVPRHELRGFRDSATGEVISYSDVKEYSTFLSTALARKHGVRAGTNVSIFCSNSIWYPITLFAAIRLGAVVTGSSPEYNADEMAYIMKASSTALIFADRDSIETVIAAAASLRLSKDNIVLLGEAVDDHSTLTGLLRFGRTFGPGDQVSRWDLPVGQSNKEACAYLSFTSGTTSLPKAVMISHGNVIAQICQMESLGRLELPRSLLGVLPLFHITGLVQILQLPVMLNQEVVIMRKFDMKAMLETIIRYRCDELWLVPPLLIRLVNDAMAKSYDLSFVKQFNTGAAPLAKEIIDKLAVEYPDVGIRQAWGMTESTSALTLTPPDCQTYDNAHTVGKIVPETTLKVVDVETGKEVGSNHVGEIWAKGPQVTMGYLNNEKATKETYDTAGFLHTGDIGWIDDQAMLTISDRLKEMIKVKGVGVAPAELEDLLLGNPHVSDAAVIGIPDSYAGEVPKAFVVLKTGIEASSAMALDLQKFVQGKKTKSKWISGGIEFLDAIPKSASGKILRRLLRDRERMSDSVAKAAAKL